MKIKVNRIHQEQGYTIGELSIDGGSRLCYTLEDQVREVPGAPVEQWKIPGATAIPVGTYPIIVNWSEHFQTQLPLLEGVPGYEGVRIHPGNTDKDTEGCILVGADWGGGDFISRSRVAFVALFPLIHGAWARGEQITLEIA